MPYVKNISYQTRFNRKPVFIDLQGKHLIITGRNGSGKTNLLRDIAKGVKLFIEAGRERSSFLSDFEKEIKSFEGNLSSKQRKQELDYDDTYELIKLKNQIAEYLKQPDIRFFDVMKSHKEFLKEPGKILFFDAGRVANIKPVSYAAPYVSGSKKSRRVEEDGKQMGSDMEQVLVNLYVRQSLELTQNRDEVAAQFINDWMERFNERLRFLLEDESAKIHFDSRTFKIYITGNDREPYTFQDLSSGYSAIFSVFFSLLIEADRLGKNSEQLTGVVFIDEIDAHLHISLQRKILPFIIEFFPRVQFFVTTHSPFVLTSLQNAAIYDLDKNEQINDVSSYSYEAIIEGLFDVPPSSSILEEKLMSLSSYLDTLDIHRDQAEQIVAELKTTKMKMDDRSRYFLEKAIFELNKNH